MKLHLTFEQQKRAKAIGITTGVHLVLLLFLLFYKYSLPQMKPQRPMGLVVNLGTSENGFGDNQPEAIGNPADIAAQQNTQGASGFANVSLKGITTTNNPDAPGVAVKKDQSTSANPSNVNQDQHHKNGHSMSNSRAQEKTRQPKYTYSGSNGNGEGNKAMTDNPGGNEGIGTGNGDMGVPGGTPGASNYEGVPGGHGNVSALVGNRYLVSRPNPKAKFSEGGKVKIKVTVNPNGIISDYRVVSAANAQIRKIAVAKLKQVKFNKSENAKPEEFGYVNFTFTTH